jgi:hypothetical protein
LKTVAELKELNAVFWWGNLKETDCSGDLDIDKWIRLKFALKAQDGCGLDSCGYCVHGAYFWAAQNVGNCLIG